MLNKEEIKKGLRKELDRTIIANECGLSTNDFSESIKNLEGVLKYIEQLENKVKELEKVLDERFIYVTGARTIYARLMSLDKEMIVKDDLKRRNEINQLIEEWC